jgi:hypothetical protein
MKKLSAVLCFGLVLAALASQPATGGGAASSSEAAKVRALLLTQMAQFNRGQWRALWLTYTPRVRSRCSYRQFVAREQASRAAYAPIRIRRVAIRVQGARAFATYQMLVRGQVVGGPTPRNPDVYARIGGRWLDDIDAGSPC